MGGVAATAPASVSSLAAAAAVAPSLGPPAPRAAEATALPGEEGIREGHATVCWAGEAGGNSASELGGRLVARRRDPVAAAAYARLGGYSAYISLPRGAFLTVPHMAKHSSSSSIIASHHLTHHHPRFSSPPPPPLPLHLHFLGILSLSEFPCACPPPTTTMVRSAVAAVAFLVAATVAHGAAVPPPTAAAAADAALPSTTARMSACPSDKAWHAPYGTAIKIPAAAVQGNQVWTGAWTKAYSAAKNMQTLIFGANNWSKGTIRAGTGVIAYRVRVPADGRYRWSADMAAPHTTDWNDFWVRFPAGIGKQRFGSIIGVGDRWLKVYSNRGANAFVWGGGTVDHDPHMLITPWLWKGQVVEFRISGRSNKVQIAHFGLHKCKTTGRGSPKCANLEVMKRAPDATCY